MTELEYRTVKQGIEIYEACSKHRADIQNAIEALNNGVNTFQVLLKPGNKGSFYLSPTDLPGLYDRLRQYLSEELERIDQLLIDFSLFSVEKTQNS